MDKLAAFFLTARTIKDLEDRILMVERLGYDAVGLPQIAARDPLATLAAVGPKTSRITLGTGIVPIWTRTPVALAQEASVVHEACEGRFLLGVGTGHPLLINSWHGGEFRRPLQAMRDYLTILKKCFSEGSVDYQGEVFRSSFAFIGYTPPQVPVLLAALSPKMAQLAGELADGVVLWLSSPKHIREVVIPNIRKGAARAERTLDNFLIFGCLFAAPGPDRDTGRDAIRQNLLTYMQLPFYRAVMDASGFEEDLKRFDDKLMEGSIPEALAALSDDLIDDIAATGSAEEIAQTLKGFVEAGCTMPGVGIVGRYEGFPGLEEAFASIKTASDTVGASPAL